MKRLWTIEGKSEVLRVKDDNKVYTTMPEYLLHYKSL